MINYFLFCNAMNELLLDKHFNFIKLTYMLVKLAVMLCAKHNFVISIRLY
jgi:hypothetical protein